MTSLFASIITFERFGLALALEIALLFLVAHALEALVRTGAARRMLWQVAFVSAILIAWLEACGAGDAAAQWVGRGWLGSDNPQPRSEPALVVTSVSPEALAVKRLHPERSAASSRGVDPEASAFKSPAALGWAVSLWLPGLVGWLLWMGMGRLAFHCLTRRRPVRDPQTLESVRVLAEALGLRRPVRVTEIEGLSGPIAYGLLRPSIGLPPGFASRAGAAQREAMLAHELAHVAGRDVFWQLVSDLVVALVWWHPLAWTARRSFRTARELAADEASLLVEGGPAALAESLVALGGRLTRGRSVAWLGIEGVSFRSGLGRRVKRLMGLSRVGYAPVRRPVAIGAWTLGPTLLAGLALLGTLWGRWDLSRGGGGSRRSTHPWSV